MSSNKKQKKHVFGVRSHLLYRHFIPNSFEKITKTLKELNLIDLFFDELHSANNGTSEFFAVPKKKV